MAVLCGDELFIEYTMKEKETVSCYRPKGHDDMHAAWSQVLNQEVYWDES